MNEKNIRNKLTKMKCNHLERHMNQKKEEIFARFRSQDIELISSFYGKKTEIHAMILAALCKKSSVEQIKLYTQDKSFRNPLYIYAPIMGDVKGIGFHREKNKIHTMPCDKFVVVIKKRPDDSWYFSTIFPFPDKYLPEN